MNTKAKAGICILVVVVMGIFGSARKASALVLVSKDLTASAVWTKENGPYIIQDSIFIKAPLVIKPGTVVKFQNDAITETEVAGFLIASDFTAVGDALENVIFTSVCDSSNGGDTMEFCSPRSSSGRGNWSGLVVLPEYRSSVKFEYFKILYAAKGIENSAIIDPEFPYRELSVKHGEIHFCSYAAIVLGNAQPTLDGLILTNNYAAFYLDSTSSEEMPKIRNSVIADNKKVFEYYWPPYFDARYNYWGDPSGPKFISYDGKTESNPDGLGGVLFSPNILFRPWDQTDPTIPKEPVIFVPGIGASINPDLMISGLLADNWTMFDHTYDGIIKAFKTMGYQEGKNFFIAYYDWRQSNAQSAEEYLKPVIQKALARNDSAKVNIVTHSMGSLVARSYVQSSSYGNNVDKLIMIAPPNKGSSDVYALWEGGRIPSNWSSKFAMKAYLSYLTIVTSGTSNYYDVVHKYIPSLKDLLPVYDYLASTGDSQDLKSFLSMNEKNNFLLELNQGLDVLNERTELSVILGDKQPTVNKIPIIKAGDGDKHWADGKPSPLDPVRNDENGDGEVLFSSGRVNSDFQAVLEYGHSEIVSKAEKIVAERLNEELDYVFNSPEIEDEILFWTDAPAELEVTDPTDNILPKDNNENTDVRYAQEKNKNGFKILSVPNVAKGKYNVKLKGGDNGKYHLGVQYVNYNKENSDNSTSQMVEVQKNQTQELIIEVDPQNENAPIGNILLKDEIAPTITLDSPVDGTEYSDDQILPITFAFSDNVSAKENISVEMFLDDDNQMYEGKSIDLSKLTLGTHDFWINVYDEEGNGNTSEAIFSVIEPPVAVDIVAPELKIITPKEGEEYEKTEKISIEYDVSDDVSKKAEIKMEVFLDSKSFQAEELDFAEFAVGKHILKIAATDLAGNKKETSAQFSIVESKDLSADETSEGEKLPLAERNTIENPQAASVVDVALAQPVALQEKSQTAEKKSSSHKKKTKQKTTLKKNQVAQSGGVTKSREKIKVISSSSKLVVASFAEPKVLGAVTVKNFDQQALIVSDDMFDLKDSLPGAMSLDLKSAILKKSSMLSLLDNSNSKGALEKTFLSKSFQILKITQATSFTKDAFQKSVENNRRALLFGALVACFLIVFLAYDCKIFGKQVFNSA